MQRLEAKKSTRETVMPAETGNLKTVDENPHRNGLFSIDGGFRGSGRLDGGDGRDRTANPPRSRHRTGSLTDRATGFRFKIALG
jgi:hypothetical protein